MFFQLSSIIGQDSNEEKDEKLEKMFLAQQEEIKNNMKLYGFFENWKDVKFLSEYFDIDFKKDKKTLTTNHKYPIVMATDFDELSKNFTLIKIENAVQNREIKFSNDTRAKHAFCKEGDNN
jgi:hypothetical protein